MTKIAALIMVKNEAPSIATTIASLSANVDGVILVDTGSTDNTIEVVKAECEKIAKPLHVCVTQFIDFATSRNFSLDFADSFSSEYDYVIFLDANDQLIGSININPADVDVVAYHVKHRNVYSAAGDSTDFFNVKLLKMPTTQCRYKGVVHEYLHIPAGLKTKRLECNDKVHIFQDRRTGAEQSALRWKRDRVLLEAEHEREPANTRTLFYLAQTYDCLREHKLAYSTYAKRVESVGGFEEERWQSMLKCGELSDILGLSDLAIYWYTKCMIHTLRAEPLVKLAQRLLATRNNYELAYSYAKLACDLPYPTQAILFVEGRTYSYTRWHILGIVAYYAAKCVTDNDKLREERMCAGKRACEQAGDEANLKWYL